MKTFGVGWTISLTSVLLCGGQQYQSPEITLVEGDASSASYFLAAGSLRRHGKGHRYRPQQRTGRHSLRRRAGENGRHLTWGDDFIASFGELKAVDMDMNHIPDAGDDHRHRPALFRARATTLRNIYNWRVRETDRLFAMATELRKVGAEVGRGKIITASPAGKLWLRNIGTYNDHRWRCVSRW